MENDIVDAVAPVDVVELVKCIECKKSKFHADFYEIKKKGGRKVLDIRCKSCRLSANKRREEKRKEFFNRNEYGEYRAPKRLRRNSSENDEEKNDEYAEALKIIHDLFTEEMSKRSRDVVQFENLLSEKLDKILQENAKFVEQREKINEVTEKIQILEKKFDIVANVLKGVSINVITILQAVRSSDSLSQVVLKLVGDKSR